MYDNISIKLNPYLGRSKNLMEFFVIVGYEENILLENSEKDNLDNENFELSLISSVVSDLAYGVFDPDIIIKQIYPDNPKIIKIIKSTDVEPKLSTTLFYSCFDSIDGKKKILYSCHAVKFYETFKTSKSIYYVPKAFIIFSQYPYFTTFNNICLYVLAEIKNKNNNYNIPIEILLHCLVNYIPSPINNKLRLKLFSNNEQILIPKLSGYPHIDFDLCKIFNVVPINEFIKIYLLTFIEIGLLFFSPDLEKLNLFMFILNILNYPLIDSNYNWHIKSISKNELQFGDDAPFPTLRGVNTSFNPKLNFSRFNNIDYIFDIDNKEIKCINKKSIEAEEINKLLKYFEKILNSKIGKIKSYFLETSLNKLKNKIKQIKSDYDKIKLNIDTFFYINKDISVINKRIQIAFYDFILNILIQLNKDYKLNDKCSDIIRTDFKNENLAEEETIFLTFFRQAIKYLTYYDNFIRRFEAADELKVSLIFTDEYVNLKMRYNDKKLKDEIRYFELMDDFFSLKPKEVIINSQILKAEFNKNHKQRSFKLYKKLFPKQLFDLDRNLIKIFLFHKKSRDLFSLLRIREKEEIKIDTIPKINIITTINNISNSILNVEHFARTSIIYIFSIVFPLFPEKKISSFLEEVLYNLSKIKFFHRYYIYIILRSIHKYYLVNLKTKYFPSLTFENITKYCEIIKKYLIVHSIIPDREIFLFLKKVLYEKNLKDNNYNNKDNNKNDNKKDINNTKNDNNDNNDDNKNDKNNKNDNIENNAKNNNIINDNNKDDNNNKKDNNNEDTINNMKNYNDKNVNNINNDNKNDNNKKDKINFVFINNKIENYVKTVPKGIIERNNIANELIFQFKNITKNCGLFTGAPDTYQLIYSVYDNYFSNLNLNIFELNIGNLIEMIINIIHFLIPYNEAYLNNYLTNAVIYLKILEDDIKAYNQNNNNNSNENNIKKKNEK